MNAEERAEFDALTAALLCTQCGRSFAAPACGIVHAVVVSDPRLHRAVEPILARERARADAEAARAEAAEAKVARVEELAEEYEADARSEDYGGELWSTTEAAIRAALAGPTEDGEGER